MPEIGATLREARMRARIDISEIEAETKIRAKYLRALENEEWGLLPGPAYVRSFLRTYAEALDLDAKGLLEEYKLRHERPSDHDLMPIGSTRRRGGRGGGRGGGGGGRHREQRGVPRGLVVGVVVVLLLAALYLLGRGNGSDDGGTASVGTQTSTTTTTPVPARTTTSKSSSKKKSPRRSGSSSSKLVTLDIITTGPGSVSACLVDATGKLQIPGTTLHEKLTAGPFHSKTFHLKLGNGNARLRINGKIHTVPAISPVAFVITRKTFKRVDAASAPDCAGGA
jgi:cytoskeleton protein RodZ